MKSSVILLVLFCAMPSYFALFASTGMAIGIMVLSYIVGALLTVSIADEFGLDAHIKFLARVGWIVQLVGTMVVYAVHSV